MMATPGPVLSASGTGVPVPRMTTRVSSWANVKIESVQERVKKSAFEKPKNLFFIENLLLVGAQKNK
jgi:hypothetical protein